MNPIIRLKPPQAASAPVRALTLTELAELLGRARLWQQGIIDDHGDPRTTVRMGRVNPPTISWIVWRCC